MDPFLSAVLLTCLAGLATVLGGVLAVTGRTPSGRGLALALGLAAGVMTSVSVLEMLPAAVTELRAALGPLGAPAAAAACAAGAGVVLLLGRLLPEPTASADSAPDARGMRRLGLLTALAIGLHNVPEGFVTFLGTLHDPTVGLALAVAMAVHNIPEGVAVAVPVRLATGSRARALGWAAAAGLAEPVGALVCVALFAPLLSPVTLAAVFAAVAGVMVAVSLAVLVPAARRSGGGGATLVGAVAGAAVMAGSLLLLAGSA